MPDSLYNNPLTDWIGYDHLIDFIRKNNIHRLDGDFIEIGALFGGGTRKLSHFIEIEAPQKTLYVIDIFDLSYDHSVNTNGDKMANLYARALLALDYSSQYEVFQEVTKGCRNIRVIAKDSKAVELPSKALAFGIIDGNHSPEYVQNDFYLVWDRLVKGGCVAFDDYGDDLPQVTETINQIIRKHNTQLKVTTFPNSRMIYLTKTVKE